MTGLRGLAKCVPALLVCTFLCLLLLPRPSAAYDVSLVLPTSATDDEDYTQWMSLARLAADEVNARWAPANTLNLDIQRFPAEDAIQSTGYALQAGQNASQLALIAAGGSVLVDNMAAVSKWLSMPVVSFDNANSTLQIDNSMTFVKVLPQASFEVEVLAAVFSHYAWSRVGVIYSTTSMLTAIRNNIAAIPGVTVVSVPMSTDATDYTTQLQAIVRSSLNIIIIASSNPTQAMDLLNQAEQANLYTVGRAFIVLSCPNDEPFTSLPSGTLVIEALDAVEQNITDFTTKMQALDSNVYPGTGSDADLETHSILAYDAVHATAAAIEEAAATSGGSVTRNGLASALKALNYSGVSGRVSFDASTGYRLYASARVRTAVTNVSMETCMTYTNGAGGLQTLFEPTWPGGTDEVPDDSIDIIPIAVIMQLTVKPVLPYATLKQVFSYAVNQINQDPDLLPASKKLSLLLFDDEGVPSQAIQLSVPLPSFGVVGVIGGVTSSQSITTQNVVSRYGIPQISPGSTSPDLSSKTQYPTFMRTCPPDDIQATVEIGLANIWKWTDIGLIFSSDPYGVGLQAIFSQRAAANNINLISQISVDPTVSDHTAALTKMRDAGVRVLFLAVSDPSKVVHSMYALGWNPPAVVGTDTLAYPDYTVVAAQWNVPASFFEGWVTLLPSGGNGDFFDAYMSALRANPPADNGEGVINLIGSGYFLVCSSIDALNVYADSILRIVTAGGDPRNGTTMLNALYETKKTLLTGLVQFDDVGNRIGPFDVLNIRQGLPHLSGRYDSTTQQFTVLDAIIWTDGTTNIPLSTLPRAQTWLKWTSGAAIALAILAALGMIVSFTLMILLYVQRESKIILSSTWQFMLLILFGSALGYGSMFTWIGRPSPYICGLRIWLPPMAFVLIIAPLLSKTWRLHRIFTLRELKVAPIPLWRLILVCSCVVIVQLIICILWIAIGTVKTELVNDTNDRNVAYVVCKLNLANKVASYVTYGYLGCCMVVGAYLAFRVRKLPKDFNESRWIGFSIYNTLLFSGIILILGYTLNNFPVTVLILICVCTLSICTGVIAFMMVPKVWALLIHPEKRSGHHSSDHTGSAKSASLALKTPGASFATHNKDTDNMDDSHGGQEMIVVHHPPLTPSVTEARSVRKKHKSRSKSDAD